VAQSARVSTALQTVSGFNQRKSVKHLEEACAHFDLNGDIVDIVDYLESHRPEHETERYPVDHVSSSAFGVDPIPLTRL